MSVAQMEAGLGLEQPSLSQQLAALRTAGIITARREAKTVFYCLSDEKARHMVELLRRLFAGAADEASSAIEAPEIPRASPNPRKMSLGAAVFARVGSKAEPEQASSDTGNPSGPTSLGRAS